MTTNSANPGVERRPTPVEEGWRDLPLDDQLAIQIFAYEEETASDTAWVQSTRWVDLVGMR